MIGRNSKLHDDLVHEVSHGVPQEAFRSLLLGIADRIEACRANPVKLSDLMSILREDSTKLHKAVMRKGGA